MDIYLGWKQTAEFNVGLREEVVLQLTKDFGAIVLHCPKLIEKLFQKDIYVIGTVQANRKQMPKMIDDKQADEKGRLRVYFQVRKWLANGWIIGQCCYQFRGEKKVQRPSLWFLFLRLSSFTIVAWVELILWTSVLPHIVWIGSHLLDFTSAFSLI